MQGFGEPTFGPDERRIALQPNRKRLERRIFGGEYWGCIRAGVHFAAEDGGDQVGAMREAAIQGANADTGAVRNLSHGSIHSGGREYRHCRLQQGVDAALSVRAQTPLPGSLGQGAVFIVLWSVAHIYPTC